MKPKSTVDSPPSRQVTLEEVKKMSDLDIRWTVAKIDGWEVKKSSLYHNGCKVIPAINSGNLAELLSAANVPDYPHDLNAVHEATIKPPDHPVRAAFAAKLQYVLFGHDWEELTAEEEFQFVNATARQRCEALVLTLQQNLGER